MITQKTDPTVTTCVKVMRRERDIRPYHLDQISGEGTPRRIALDAQELVLGRGDDAQIELPSRRTSRLHAYLTRRGTEYMIRDNDSRNGVLLNGIKIHSAMLRDGDVLQVADCVFVYREG